MQMLHSIQCREMIMDCDQAPIRLFQGNILFGHSTGDSEKKNSVRISGDWSRSELVYGSLNTLYNKRCSWESMI